MVAPRSTFRRDSIDYKILYTKKVFYFLVMKNKFKFLDLTHSLDPTIPSWNGNCGFNLELLKDYANNSMQTSFRNHQIVMEAGMGTHCVQGGDSIAALPLSSLIAPCQVIDVSAQANATFELSVKDIKHFETQHRKLLPGGIVLIYTGWDRFWEEPEKYRNDLVFPCVSKDAAELFLERGINGLGIDTLSPDRPESGYPVHQLLLGAGKYIIENVANAKLLPTDNSYLLALPIKIEGATEAPIRLVGMVEED